MKHRRIVMLLAVWLGAGLAVDLGTASTDGWTRTREPHVTGSRFPKAKTPRARRDAYRGGTTIHRHRDSFGNTVTTRNGKTTVCHRSAPIPSDVYITCR